MPADLRALAKGTDVVVAVSSVSGRVKYIPATIVRKGTRWITAGASGAEYRFDVTSGESDYLAGDRPRLITPVQAAAEQEHARITGVLRQYGILTGQYRFDDREHRAPSGQELAWIAAILDGTLIPHDPGECCCKNCPWGGNHGDPHDTAEETRR